MRIALSIAIGGQALASSLNGGAGPALLLDFVQRRYRSASGGTLSADLSVAATFTRASTGIASDLSGSLIPYGATEPRRNTAGLLYEPAATNYLPYGAKLDSGWGFLNGGTGAMPSAPAASAASASVPSPDGLNADSGKGVTCTGLAIDATRDLVLVLNDGRNLDGEAMSNGIWTPSIVLLDPATLAKTGEIALPFLDNIGAQGIAHDSAEDLYATVVPSAAFLRFFDPETGALAGSVALPAPITEPNGLAFDSLRDCFWISDNATGGLYRVSRTGTLLFTYRPGPAELPIDHLHYDAAADILLMTNGANATNGKVWAYSPVLDRVTRAFTATGARAIEGVVVRGGDIILANDGYFHSVAPASIPAPYDLNQLLIYPASALVPWRQHRVMADYAELPALGRIADRVILDKGTGATAADYDLLATSAVASGASATKTLSLWVRTTHGDTVTIALRCDTVMADVRVGPEWQRIAISGTIGSVPAVQFGLRRGGAPYNTSDFADICVALCQLEAGAIASSEIANTGAGSATRAADVLSIPLPEGVTAATVTFDDGSTQVISGLTNPWIVPTDLSRKRIHRIEGDPA